jgi:hypothetical protein
VQLQFRCSHYVDVGRPTFPARPLQPSWRTFPDEVADRHVALLWRCSGEVRLLLDLGDQNIADLDFRHPLCELQDVVHPGHHSTDKCCIGWRGGCVPAADHKQERLMPKTLGLLCFTALLTTGAAMAMADLGSQYAQTTPSTSPTSTYPNTANTGTGVSAQSTGPVYPGVVGPTGSTQPDATNPNRSSPSGGGSDKGGSGTGNSR